MKNKNYSVLGKILGILNNDFPPYVSKTFSDNVMKNIHMNTDSKNFNYKKLSRIPINFDRITYKKPYTSTYRSGSFICPL